MSKFNPILNDLLDKIYSESEPKELEDLKTQLLEITAKLDPIIAVAKMKKYKYEVDLPPQKIEKKAEKKGSASTIIVSILVILAVVTALFIYLNHG